MGEKRGPGGLCQSLTLQVAWPNAHFFGTRNVAALGADCSQDPERKEPGDSVPGLQHAQPSFCKQYKLAFVWLAQAWISPQHFTGTARRRSARGSTALYQVATGPAVRFARRWSVLPLLSSPAQAARATLTTWQNQVLCNVLSAQLFIWLLLF